MLAAPMPYEIDPYGRFRDRPVKLYADRERDTRTHPLIVVEKAFHTRRLPGSVSIHPEEPHLVNKIERKDTYV